MDSADQEPGRGGSVRSPLPDHHATESAVHCRSALAGRRNPAHAVFPRPLASCRFTFSGQPGTVILGGNAQQITVPTFTLAEIPLALRAFDDPWRLARVGRQ
uniref:Uncharacterized protein n=1 Tax=Tanacetum cinerariifolium TaxID=118510 RepID=A0A699U3L9_TANCI|nr:hypothetical protein [Tanacetum cinerariifolium]